LPGRKAMVESATMERNGTYRIEKGWLETRLWLCGVAWAIALGWGSCCGIVRGQIAEGTGGQGDAVTTVRGRVLNQVTKEPIGRALVTTLGDQYATLTDDRGQFEFKFPAQEGQANSAAGGAAMNRLSGSMKVIMARKPGFLPTGRNPASGRAAATRSEVTIYLVPESLIVGHVNVPGSEGDVRIMCELYKRAMREGQEIWSAAGTFTTWEDGEFRFSELAAGTYKLITHEQMDRESLLPIPGAQLFGYPPIYYSNTTDFSLASPIVVGAGETAQANLAVARRQYYPVRIPVANAPMGGPMNLLIYPMGHHGPGWSLGYDATEQAIEGMLPDGNYTVEADALGPLPSTGILNFSVKGAAFEGAALNLIPNATLSVSVREEFRSGQSNQASGGTPASDERENGGGRFSVHVNLTPLEEIGSMRNRSSLSAEVSEGLEMTIPNVRPGRYHVNVISGKGYAAAVQSGGSDLMDGPLVVGWGGGNSAIEVTLRDDGAEVSGTVEETTSTEGSTGQNGGNTQFRYVYLLPLGGSTGPRPLTVRTWDKTFKMQQVSPGNYLLVAFDQVQQDLPYGNEEAMRGLESEGQVIHVESGQKVNVNLKVIAGSELQ